MFDWQSTVSEGPNMETDVSDYVSSGKMASDLDNQVSIKTSYRV